MTKSELMTTEREIQLVRELNREAGSYEKYKRALDELVLANTGLIHKIVHKFPVKNASVTYDDLFQAGIEGLIHGIQKFDVTRGYRLSTYCYRWIQAYVSRYWQNHGKTIRIPVHMANLQMKVKKATELLTKEMGRTPSQSEIEDIVPEASNASGLTDCVSLNQMIAESDELEAVVGEDKTEVNDYQTECELLLEKLKDEVSSRDFNIFVHRHGLMGIHEKTLGEIAEHHGITRARVHQVTNDCFKRMRTFVN